MTEPSAELPLAGVRVIDAADELGAYLGRLLADLGADVVKVRSAGPSYRQTPPFTGEGTSIPHAYFESNKRGVDLDVADPASRHDLKRLAEGADVVIITPRPDLPLAGWDADRRCLDWASRTAIIVSVTPFGLSGPLSTWNATHLTSCALSGLLTQHGPVRGEPVVIPDDQMYSYVCTRAAAVVLARLRERAGAVDPIDRFIDLSAHEILAAANLDVVNYARYAVRADRAPDGCNETGGIFECADGAVQLLVASPAHWRGLVDLLGRPDALLDPALEMPSARAGRLDEVLTALRIAIKRRFRRELVEAGQQMRVPCAPVNSIEEFVEDAQPVSREFFQSISIDGRLVAAPGAPALASRPLFDLYRHGPAEPGQADLEDLIAQWSAPAQAGPAPRPLENIRVLSFGTVLSGGLAASALADLGADVVKIESFERPDLLRSYVPVSRQPQTEPSGATVSASFTAVNRSVRSLAMDMRKPAAVDLFVELVRSADVVLSNFPVGVMDQWGVPATRLARENPALIQVSISGFGAGDGPRSRYAAYGTTVCSFIGLTAVWGYAGPTHHDYVAHSHAVLCVLAALARRDREGVGITVDLAMSEAGSTLMGPSVLRWTVNGDLSAASGNRIPGAVWSGVRRCSGEDKWVAIEVRTEEERLRFAELLRGSRQADAAVRPIADEEVDAWLADLTPLQASLLLQERGIAAAPVQDVEDVYRDIQLRARGAVTQSIHPDLGEVQFVGPRHAVVPAREHAFGARLGQHGEQVLADWLGLDERARAALRDEGAFASLSEVQGVGA